MTNRYLEAMNYENDTRVRHAGMDVPFGISAVDEKRMKGLVIMRADDDTETEHWVPLEFEVCFVCNGNGSHVNPSIDAGGLTREDFDEDPDFREAYMSGLYNETCRCCNGRRVVFVIMEKDADPEVLKYLREQAEEEASYRALERAERIMGC